jgi:hypothetical protein
MPLKIDASGLFSRNYLLLKRDGCKFYENGMLWGARRFRFREIGCVLMSEGHKLSFQVGNEVFSIQTKPDRAKHQAAIAALLAGVEDSKLPAGSAVRYSP